MGYHEEEEMKKLSPWGENLNVVSPLQEYPRMQLQRDSYLSLNGVWEYQIVKSENELSKENWKEIVVPFALGSKLSQVEEELHADEFLYYRKHFLYEKTENNVILNFEAVDQITEVYLNGVLVGEHRGGYTPFEFDITRFVKEDNELIIKVSDPSDSGLYAYGKQKVKHGGMWYTPSSGIWQSVWIEELQKEYISDIKITPDYDHSCVYLNLAGKYEQAVITVVANGEVVHRGVTVEKEYKIVLDDFHPWSIDDPFLYDLYIGVEEETIKSYFGMRKFSTGTDERGYQRFFLNDKPLFLNGLLDQGYSIDGLLTFPSDEAMVYEIEKIKEMGFNMIRMHAKVECRRFYYLCDKYGLLVMQDIPNGALYDFAFMTLRPNLLLLKQDDHIYDNFGREKKESREAYYKELSDILDDLYNAVCIFAWVPFNEGWGQFDSKEVTEYIKDYDSTRLVDSASGWYDQGAGDFHSIHNYFLPFRVPKEDGRVLILSEFGGYSYLEKKHSEAEKLYGYKKFKDRVDLDRAIQKLYQNTIIKNIPKGLSGCIYTQVSDVEDECNGLFTADRKMVKIDIKKMKKLCDKCQKALF